MQGTTTGSPAAAPEALLPAMARNVAATYNAAADHFDEAALGFWNRHGQRAVERLNLLPGDRVLDVGCGSGASALPAAGTVGPSGEVIGIDLAEQLLKLGRAKAGAVSLRNITFTRADMTATGLPDASFDAVVSVFSIFFVADMTSQIAELWRMVRPGGQLAITVWGTGAFGPVAPIFQEEVRRLRPDIPYPLRPWERLTNPANLRELMLAGGTAEPSIETVADVQPLKDPDDFWTVAMGSGFRGEIEQLTLEHRDRVRWATARRLAAIPVTEIEMNAIHATALKPS